MKIVSNQVVLTGNLGRSPELMRFDSGNYKCSFSLATNEFVGSPTGEKTQRAVWHQIVVWGKKAEEVAGIYSKGDFVTITGRLKYRTYTDKEGIFRKIAEVIADEMEPVQRQENAIAA